MNEFNRLIEITKRLFGPGGCPWDQVQTMQTIRPCIIEESSELVDAIDSNDNAHIREELGDLFFVAVFLCFLFEKEGKGSFEEVLESLNDKLVRRHPHVFGEAKVEDVEGVLKQWKEVKNQESKSYHKSVLDSIPKGLPALARAQKVYKKLQEAKFNQLPKEKCSAAFNDEDSLGKVLWSIVAQAKEQKLDAEHALRKLLVQLESSFRESESNNPPSH